MKRKLSLLMVLMMVISLIPAMPSFAASGDITVAKQATDLVLNSYTGAPTLDVNGNATGGFTEANAPSLVFDNTAAVTTNLNTKPITTDVVFTVTLTDGNAVFAENAYPVTTGANATAIKTGPYTLEVTFTPNTALTPESFSVPMFIRATGSGDVKVRVSDRLSGFKNITDVRTIAVINKSMTNAYVDKVGNIARNNTIVEVSTSQARVRLVESTNGSWAGAQPIEIRLDSSDYYFYNIGVNGTQAKFKGLTQNGILSFNTIDNNRTLVVDVAAIAGLSSSFRDEIILDLPIRVSRDARIGTDVTASLRGDVTPTTLTLAKYTDYAVELEAVKVLDVIAGQDVPGRYVSKIRMDETVPGSLLDGRVLEVKLVGMDKDSKVMEEVAALQFGEQIKLDKVRGTGDLNIVNSVVSTSNAISKSAIVNRRADGSTGDYILHDLFEVEVNRGSNISNIDVNNADRWELTVPFVVDTDFSGPLYLQFDGAGVEKQTVKIADVKAPVTFKVGTEAGKLADLNIGQQFQPVPMMTITETEAGALLEKDVVRGFDNTYGIVPPSRKNNIVKTGYTTFVEGDVELKAGDARVDDYDTNSDRVIFYLKERSSKTPSEFVIDDVKVTLDRTVPYGPFKVSVDAGNVAARHDLSDKISTVEYFNVVTPFPTDKNIKTVFTIGEMNYVQTLSGVPTSVTMDVAPQIMMNRTMMPIRYVADSLGAKVNYDPATRTAIFSKDTMVISMTLDSKVMYVNGSPVVMDVAPMVQNSRALVSLVNVAQAFGLNSVSSPAMGDIVYDASLKTVTLFPTAN